VREDSQRRSRHRSQLSGVGLSLPAPDPTTPNSSTASPNGSSGNGAAPRPKRDFDAIVVGGGHNGLTTGAYLAKAGLSVCVLERRDILGGACVAEEVFPGARISRASDVVSMLQPRIVEDLRLRDYG
jgi:NAD(P)-binding Rossmann-like domain